MQRRIRKLAPVGKLSDGSKTNISNDPHDNSHPINNLEFDDVRGRAKSFLPKGAIRSLLLLIGTATMLALYRLSQHSKPSPSGLRIKLPTAASRNTKNIPASPSSIVSIHEQTILNDSTMLTSPSTNATLHLIFSTDCSPFQHWQSYLFFYSALRVHQPGYITRIVSGCDDIQMVEEKKWHETHIQRSMSERFRVHFTPHFSGVKDEITGEVKGDYKFFNKPFGLKHFLEYSEYMGVDGNNGKMKNPDVIIILCDPDFVLLRPITDDFSNERETLISPRRKQIFDETQKVVTQGHPYAQTYGLGTQWRKFNLSKIAGDDSPAKTVDQSDGQLFYPVGPPYIGTANDMYKIAISWTEFVPRVHAEYPNLLAEMYAYCIAAAHLQLPHTLIDSLMVSSAGVGGEGWKFIQAIPSSEICTFGAHPDHAKYPLPSVVHYCQRYPVDKYFYGKRKVPHEIFTCDFPLLVEPPIDIGSGKYLSVMDGSKKKPISTEKEKMDGFMLCALTVATNDAMIHFKDRHCAGGGNREKSYDMWASKN